MKRTTRPSAALSAVAAAVFALAAPAHAGFTNSVVLDSGYDATQPLTNGTVYIVEKDVWFEGGASDGKSGLAVAPGATVAIYVKKGVRFDVRGVDGVRGGAGGGAGILLPNGAELVVTGSGYMVAVGGKAASGEDRSLVAERAWGNDDYSQPGRGGKGGDGGGGAGAGIGGTGGTGGIGHEAPTESPVPTEAEPAFERNGKNGVAGGPGGNGSNAGKVWLLGSVYLWAPGCDGGAGGEGHTRSHENNNYIHDEGTVLEYAFRNYYVGGGGMGGGGAGGGPAAGIGGGGGGGGAGGSGGNGGLNYYTMNSGGKQTPIGGWGYGGKSSDGQHDGKDGWADWSVPLCSNGYSFNSYAEHSSDEFWGGMRGAAGAAGANGSGGTLYRMSTATFDGTADADTTISLAVVPNAVKYDVIFNSGGSYPQSVSSVVLGVPLADCIAAADVPVPTRFAKTFLGWFTEENGAGTKWFNADGSVANAPEIYETVGSTTLYAAWRDEDLAPWRVDLAGIEVGSGSVVLSLKAASAEKFAEAKPHLHVYASRTLPVPETAEARIVGPAIVDNGDGTGTATFPLDPDLGAQFYEIGVGD